MTWEPPLAQAGRLGKRKFTEAVCAAPFFPPGMACTAAGALAEPDVKDTWLVRYEANLSNGSGMSAVFDRLSLYQKSRRPARRKVSRTRVKARAVLISGENERRAIAICDVSPHGCSIRGEALALRAGRFVGIELGADAPIQALVRWVNDEEAGLEFLRPVPADRTDWQLLINPA